MNVSVVIPVRNNLDLTMDIVDQLCGQPGWDRCYIFDNGSTDNTWTYLQIVEEDDERFQAYSRPEFTIYQMWDNGYMFAKEDGADICVFLNNDIRMPANLIRAMKSVFLIDWNIGIVYPNYNLPVAQHTPTDFSIKYTQGTYRHGGMSGFCFAIRMAHVNWAPLVDPEFKIWYGDDDIAFSMQRAGFKQARLLGWPVEHIGQATCNQFPEVFADVPNDKIYFEQKWGKR